MSNLWNREPALILAAVGAIIALAIGFGAPVTAAQLALIMAAVSAVLALFVRSQVTPNVRTGAELTAGGMVAGNAPTGIPAGTPVEVVPTSAPGADPVVPE